MARRPLARLLLPALAALLGLVLLVVLLPGSPADWAAFVVNRDTRPTLFLLLMLLLPIFGFPVTPFLLLVGLKFGALWGATATAVVFALHLLICYGLTHSLLRPLVNRFLAGTDYHLPQLQEQRRLVFSLVFMAVPGLPYAIKNYTLATLKVPFRIYFPVGWGVNMVLAVPLIGVGFSLTTDPRLAVIFVGLLAAAYAVTYWLHRKYRDRSADREGRD